MRGIRVIYRDYFFGCVGAPDRASRNCGSRLAEFFENAIAFWTGIVAGKTGERLGQQS